MIVFRIAVSLFAILLMLTGLIITPMPIPFGLIIFALGFFLLAAVAPAFVRGVRKRWRWFDRQMHRIEKRLPKFMADPLKVTDYDHAEDDGDPVEVPR